MTTGARDSASFAGESMSYGEMLSYSRNVAKNGNRERAEKLPRSIQVLDVESMTASAKLTAWWGTDYLLLSKINNRWMITHVLWQSPPRK